MMIELTIPLTDFERDADPAELTRACGDAGLPPVAVTVWRNDPDGPERVVFRFDTSAIEEEWRAQLDLIVGDHDADRPQLTLIPGMLAPAPSPLRSYMAAAGIFLAGAAAAAAAAAALL